MCFLGLKVIVVDPNSLSDMLRDKTFGYDSPGTTQRAPKEDPNIGQGAAQGSEQVQELDLYLTKRA